MEVAFDSEISLSDVVLINKIRFWLNSVMGAASYSLYDGLSFQENIQKVNQKTTGFFFELITKPRRDIEVIASASYKWNLVKPNHRADFLQSPPVERVLVSRDSICN
ncbi:hypothetical protein OUZ56_003137 [Daphnia magna]|uniref:Uncharacterized protein n=1 Tax=Daphnia magna TaxID=35525 RepID=A0ABR0A846_9CRUS|nr:hypothetical protein OUZ56_003137 [Daphnia magna]